MNLTSIQVKGDVDFSGLTSTDVIDARRLQVGELVFRDAALQAEGKGYALILDGAVITGNLDMDRLQTEGPITARGTKMNGLDLSDARLQSVLDAQVLDLSRAEIAGRANLDGTVANATISFYQAKMGQLDLRGTNVHVRTGTAVEMSGLSVAGTAFGEGLVLQGVVNAADASFGELNFPRITIDSLGSGRAMNLARARIRGNAILSNSVLQGALFLFGAQVGHLDLMAMTIRVKSGPAIELSRADVTGTAACARLRLQGVMNAADARFAQLILEGCTFEPSDGQALDMPRVFVAGRANLRDLRCAGTIRASGGHVGGTFDLSAADISSKGERGALDISQCDFKGHLVMEHIHVLGQVYGRDARISRLTVRDAVIDGGPGDAVDLSSASVTTLDLLPGIRARGGINFTDSTIGNLVTAEEAPQNEFLPPLSNATSWHVGAVHGALRTDRREMSNWLSTIPLNGQNRRFTAHPWKEMARVYDQLGQPEDAKWIRRKAASRLTRLAPLFPKTRRLLYSWTVGYGYYPLLVLVWLAALWLTTFVLASSQAASFSPSDSTKAMSTISTAGEGQARPLRITGETDPAPSDYPPFSPGLYAVDTALPAISTGQSSAWRVTGNTWLPAVFAIIKGAGWVLSAMFLAGATGLLRKD